MKAITAIALQLAMAFLIVACNDSPTDIGLPGTSELEPATVVSTTQPVTVIGVGTIVGEATITRNANGASANFHTSGLTPGTVYSLWWAVFGNPEFCTPPCDAVDIVNPLVNGGAEQAASHVVGGSGKASYGSRLNQGDVLTGGGAPTFNTFDDVLGSEIHLVVRSHGPKVPGSEQLFGFNGGCPPSTCVNVQASMHPAPAP